MVWTLDRFRPDFNGMSLTAKFDNRLELQEILPSSPGPSRGIMSLRCFLVHSHAPVLRNKKDHKVLPAIHTNTIHVKTEDAVYTLSLPATCTDSPPESRRCCTHLWFYQQPAQVAHLKTEDAVHTLGLPATCTDNIPKNRRSCTHLGFYLRPAQTAHPT